MRLTIEGANRVYIRQQKSRERESGRAALWYSRDAVTFSVVVFLTLSEISCSKPHTLHKSLTNTHKLRLVIKLIL